MSGQQTLNFRPDLYLDIDSVRKVKQQALDCHRSQNPDAIWEAHEAMHRLRGKECSVERAEAYVRAEAKEKRPSLPLLFETPKK
jgi:LmbE family N-acetylglucosaminyl deacetylase